MNMLRNSLLAVSLGSLAALAPSQCATLTVVGTGAPGTTLQFTADGTTANLFAFLLVSAAQGTTVLPLGPLGALTLGLEMPVVPVPLGMTNASGDAALSLAVPANVPFGVDVFGQAGLFGFSFTPPTGGGLPTFGLTTCTSNVVGFHVGI